MPADTPIPAVERSFEFQENFVRVHADEWQIIDTSGSNVELTFQRDVLMPPDAMGYSVREDSNLELIDEAPATQKVITEILCSVRLRPDQAFDLAEQLLRHLHQMQPAAAQDEDGPLGSD